MHSALMTDDQIVKKFEAKIPWRDWEPFENWLEGRGKLTNPQILVGLLRLFVSQPEEVQLKALFGREANIAPAKEPQMPLDAVRDILRSVTPGTRRLLSPDEQRQMDECRRLLGPSQKEINQRKEKRA
jgi:hypothetical protein